jgi:hypothetical protein
VTFGRLVLQIDKQRGRRSCVACVSWCAVISTTGIPSGADPGAVGRYSATGRPLPKAA